jgi:glucose dehydrogenase
VNSAYVQEHVHAVPSRRDALIAGAALLAVPLLGRVTSIVHAAEGAKTVLHVGSPVHAQAGKVNGTVAEWSSYGGDKASSKYSPLAQINGGNFSRLEASSAGPKSWTLAEFI